MYEKVGAFINLGNKCLNEQLNKSEVFKQTKQVTLDKHLNKETVDFYNEFAVVVENKKKLRMKLRGDP